MRIIQIGTNKGNDDLTTIVKNINPSDIDLLVFVEPLSYCNEDIKSCYTGYNFHIENSVISNDPTKEFETFYTSDTYHRLSSLNKDHIKNHGLDTVVNELTVPALSINNLLDKYGVTELDILFVDAESFDHEIIKSIDFNKYKIDKIYYENVHGENHLLHEYLIPLGYEVHKCDFHDGLTNVAELKK